MAGRYRMVRDAWTSVRERSRSRGRRRRATRGSLLDGTLFWVLLGAVSLVVGGYAALCLIAGAKVPGGTRVDGVAIGGLEPAAAVRRLEQVLPERMAQPVRVTGGGVTQDVDPAAAGLSLDARASVAAAGGRRDYGPGRIWRYYTGGGDDLPAELDVDTATLTGTVRKIGLAVDTPMVEGGVVFAAGAPKAVQPADGRRLRQGETARALADRVANAGQVRPQVELPVTVLRPTVSPGEVSRAMTTYGVPLASAPVTLAIGKQQVTAPPRLYTQGLELVADDGRLRPRVDVAKLFDALEPIINSVPGAPRPARIVVRGDRPVVVPSRKGVTFDRADLQRKFLVAAMAPAGQRKATVRGVSAEPSFTTAAARALKVRQRVGSFTSRFGYAGIVGGGNQNISRGAQLIDDTLLKPGQSFSFNRAVGRPTPSRGFEAGRSLRGAVFVPDPGAGLSQLASTLFNALLPTGIAPTRRSVDSVPSDRLPVGREASVRYGSRDLTFTNDSRYGLLVSARTSAGAPGRPGSVTVSLWSTKRYDVTVTTGRRIARAPARVLVRRTAACEPTVGASGFTVRLQRVLRPVGGGATKRDTLTTVYPVTPSVVCAAPRG